MSFDTAFPSSRHLNLEIMLHDCMVPCTTDVQDEKQGYGLSLPDRDRLQRRPGMA